MHDAEHTSVVEAVEEQAAKHGYSIEDQRGSLHQALRQLLVLEPEVCGIAAVPTRCDIWTPPIEKQFLARAATIYLRDETNQKYWWWHHPSLEEVEVDEFLRRLQALSDNESISSS